MRVVNVSQTRCLDYLLPTATEVPDIEIEHLEFDSEKLIGFRGVGEGGTILAPPPSSMRSRTPSSLPAVNR